MSDLDEAEDGPGCLAFLEAEIPKEDLDAALRVIRAFKACESREEWAMIPFAAWAKLEQLEDYLKLRTGEAADEVTDEVALQRWAALNP
jgi:hypothetical protein